MYGEFSSSQVAYSRKKTYKENFSMDISIPVLAAIRTHAILGFWHGEYSTILLLENLKSFIQEFWFGWFLFAEAYYTSPTWSRFSNYIECWERLASCYTRTPLWHLDTLITMIITLTNPAVCSPLKPGLKCRRVG